MATVYKRFKEFLFI